MEERCILQGGTLYIYIPRELDHHAAGILRAQADGILDVYPVRRLVFDFAETEFMDSSGIGMMIGRAKNMGYRGGEVLARHVGGRVEKIFRMSGLHKLIRLECSASDDAWEKGGTSHGTAE